METMVKPPRTGMEAFKLMPEGTLCQLINDVLITSPAPTPKHQHLSKKIFKAIERLVESKELGELFFSPIDIYLNETNVLQPDIVFIAKEQLHIINWNKGIIGAPQLVVEILSKGNKNIDLNKKKRIYEQFGLNEYWLIDPQTKWCEGFVLENGVYKSLGEGKGQLTIETFDLLISF